MELKKVYLHFTDDDDDDQHKQSKQSENLVYWPASNIPRDPKFTFEQTTSTSTSNNSTNDKLIAQSDILYESFNDKINDEYNYFIAELQQSDDDNNDEDEDHHQKKNHLICKPAKIFRMLPNFTFKDLIDEKEQEKEPLNRLSKREQLDELRGKFGSKKSQRDLASKRKYEIQFGEDDVEDLPSIIKKQEEERKNETKKEENIDGKIEGTDDTEQLLSTILPNRDVNAKKIDLVYSLDDIITLEEKDSIKEYENELFDLIENSYLKSLVPEQNDSNNNNRLIAIYADILLQLIKLHPNQMKRDDPLPKIIYGDIKKYIFERFTLTKKLSSRQMSYIITDLNKDRIFIYIIILIFMLNNFKPIELDKFIKDIGINLRKLRRFLELIGCYVENKKTSFGVVQKVAVLRLPLFVPKESDKAKRLRR